MVKENAGGILPHLFLIFSEILGIFGNLMYNSISKQ
jgi:hypothetical protein